MAASTWLFTNNGRTNLLNGTFDLDSDTFYMALFTSGSNIGSGSTTYNGLTGEHANGNGYYPGGMQMGSFVVSGIVPGVIPNPMDIVWTPSGGPITARYGVIYENVPSGNILCYSVLDDTPADVTAEEGSRLTISFHASGVFTVSPQTYAPEVNF